MNYSNPADKIIVAIDGMNIKESLVLLKECPSIKWIKIGLELFSREGPSVIKIFKDMNKRIFLDLKFHDIPNTMSSASYQVSKLGVDIISVHASAGTKALKVSKEATLRGAKEMNKKPPFLIGITVLTSFSNQEFQNEINRTSSIEDNVLRLAQLAYNAGLDGCVCSPLELKKLRKIYDNNFQLITPGISFGTDNIYDQQRVMSPKDAILNGASKIVVGRSITKAKDINKRFLEICGSIY